MRKLNAPIKYFNGVVYKQYTSGRWFSLYKHFPLSHAVWNVYNPSDIITRYDGYVIHHVNKDPSDDDIYNLMKLNYKDHRTIHSKWNKEMLDFARKIRNIGYTYKVVAIRVSGKFGISISSVCVRHHLLEDKGK